MSKSRVSSDKRSREHLLAEIEALRARVDEAEQTLEAIRRGEVDAFVVEGPQGDQVFSLSSVERIYRTVVETMNEGALTVSADSTILFCNLRFAKLLHKSTDEILGRTLTDFLEAPHQDDLLEMIAASQTEPSRRRLLVRLPDGGVIPVQFSGTFLPSESGSATCLVATDLTQIEASTDFIRFLEEHQQELEASRDRLQESESRFRAMTNDLPFMIWMVDSRGKLALVNQTYCEFFGIGSNEAMGDNWQLLVHPEDSDAYVGEFLDCMRERRPFHQRARVKNAAGEWRWIESFGRPRFSGSGEFLGFVGTSPDITERQLAVDAMKKSEARLRLLSEASARLLSAEDPLPIIDDLARRVMEHLNCQFFFHFIADEQSGRLKLIACAGIPPETAHSIRFLDYGVGACGCVARDGQRIVVVGIPDSQDPMTEMIRGFGIQAYCCHPVRGQGKVFGTLSFGTQTRSHFSQDEIGLMQTVADQAAVAMQRLQTREKLEIAIQGRTAELVAANRELQTRTDQLRMLSGELAMAEQRERKRLAELLHDGLQQYLSAIKLQVGQLAVTLDGDGAAESAQIEDMLSEAIHISRSLSAELSPPVLYEKGFVAALEWFGRTMADQHAFKVNCRARNRVKLSDDVNVLLFQTVKELLFNSAKHSGASAADVDVYVDDGMLHVAVSDSGCGFDPLSLNAGGNQNAGFGLFSIRERMALLGGSLEILAAPGRGSRFTVKIPWVGRDEENPTASITGNAIRVLLADDHSIFREGLARICRKTKDIQVVGHADSGKGAIDLAEKLMPDVILMDINMPQMNGIDATAVICGRHPEIRVIGLSMYEDDQSVRRMRQAGAVDYVSKSSAASSLLAAIRRNYAPRCEP